MARYHIVKYRNIFDINKNITDPLEARKLVISGEKRVHALQSREYKYFPDSPGGVQYERRIPPPDWMLDRLYPVEKAQYPEYFARREVRKQEFIDRWLKKYGKDAASQAD